MNNVSLGDYANIISALAAAFSLLAPVIYAWVSQRARLGKAEVYIEALKLSDELKKLLVKHTEKNDPLVHHRLNMMVAELEVDIKKQSRTQPSLRLFNIALFIEILVLMTLWLSGSSKWLTTFFEARSNESGIGFFEGVLQAPEMRLTIIILNLLSAAFINRYIIKKIQRKIHSTITLNLTSIVSFHIVMATMLACTYLLLSTLDVYFSFF